MVFSMVCFIILIEKVLAVTSLIVKEVPLMVIEPLGAINFCKSFGSSKSNYQDSLIFFIAIILVTLSTCPETKCPPSSSFKRIENSILIF